MKTDFYYIVDYTCEAVIIFKTKDEAEKFLRTECQDNPNDYELIKGHFGECIFI